jgi:hypothetical protein
MEKLQKEEVVAYSMYIPGMFLPELRKRVTCFRTLHIRADIYAAKKSVSNKSIEKIMILSLHNLCSLHNVDVIKLKLNSVALVCERTITADRPPLSGEVNDNFGG